MSKKVLLTRTAVLASALLVAASLTVLRAGQTPAGSVSIDADDIGGVVTGAKGPEAGVWVIAETRDTPTRLIKSVVTDDQGRYLVPDLPKANYDVWVRGYGLVDSPKSKATPGTRLNLKAVTAPERESRGGVLPGAVLVLAAPGAAHDRLPGHRTAGQRDLPRTSRVRANGSARSSTPTAAPAVISWADKATRELPPAFETAKTSEAAWDRRIQSGQAGGGMSNRFSQVGRARALAMYANWTDRIAAGELPTATPARPQGRERNVVITMWDWADPKVYAHDEIATDKRNPTRQRQRTRVRRARRERRLPAGRRPDAQRHRAR